MKHISLFLFIALYSGLCAQEKPSEIIYPNIDGTVQENLGKSLTDDNKLYLRNAVNYHREAYLSFDVSKREYNKVVLELSVKSLPSDKNEKGTLVLELFGTMATLDLNNLNYANQPSIAELTAIVLSTEVSSSDKLVQLDITDYYNRAVQEDAKKLTLKLSSNTRNAFAQFHSDNASRNNIKPKLKLYE